MIASNHKNEINDQLKIALIIPYFGNWPTYFNIYLKSCANNKWLNVYFFTDCQIPDNHPQNVTFIPFTLREISFLASKKIKKEFRISHAYKLCDFKPCYGLIFEDYLKDYDYWGYGDIDLVYGDLEPIIKDRIAAGFDVLSNRLEILSGSLAFFKNTHFLKNLFANSSTLVDELSEDNYKGLDETAHNNLTWFGGDKLDLPNYCFTYLVANEAKKGIIKASFITTCREIMFPNDIINYQKGVLYFEETSLAYYHYVNDKGRSEYKLPNWSNVPDTFFITSTGFYKTDKLYWFIHHFRKIAGYINYLSIRAWKRLIKK